DLTAIVLLHLDDAVRVQGGEAVEGRDLVGLEQHRDAAGELLHDAVLAGDHRRHVDLRVAGADAVLRERVHQVVVLVRGVEQRLGRNAAHAQAGAAEGRFAVLAERGVDAGDLHAQLRRADRGVVAGGAGADDDNVELLLLAHFIRSAGSWPPARGGWGRCRVAAAAGRGRPAGAPAAAVPGSEAQHHAAGVLELVL